MNTKELNEMILSNPEFDKLKEIGGCKDYHLEGDSYVHTLIVFENAKKMFGEDHWMTTVALLHDIGKIYTGVFKDDDWHYPNHAVSGAEHLKLFIPEDNDMYKVYYWYIENHIKPLYWRFKGIKYTEKVNDLCNVDYLRKLAICDVMASYSKKPQDELINYLEKLEL